MVPPPGLSALVASPRVHSLLARLHAESEAQEKSLSQYLFWLRRNIRYLFFSELWSSAADNHMRDKFIALEEDKCHALYLLTRSIGATNIVEAGTSFGVSTIYLALAVGQNVADRKARGDVVTGKVIGTEKEPSKAERARGHWDEAGEEVVPWIELREGDLLETLKVEDGMPKEIDLLLLDSESSILPTPLRVSCELTHTLVWTPLALPTLQIIKPRLRRGAVVVADNTVKGRLLYKDFLEYIYDQANGFKTTVIPYSGGLQVAVYLPDN